MNVRFIRYAFALYVVLCAAVGLNLLFLQPISLRLTSKPTEQQNLSIAKETATIESSKENSLQLPSSLSPPEGNSLTKLIEKSLFFSYPETLTEKDSIQAIQRALESKGYMTGGRDGTLTAVTQAAILAFEFDHHLPLTGEPRGNLLQDILEDKQMSKDTPSLQEMTISPTAEKIIRSVQQTLVLLGYRIEAEEGKLGQRTIASIRQFEVQQGMPETGRISGELIMKLGLYKQKKSASDSG